MNYFFITGTADNKAYDAYGKGIKVKMKDGSVIDAAAASDHQNLEELSVKVEKYFVCYPKG
jgi:hypothetical protein